MRHLLGIEQLNLTQLSALLESARGFIEIASRDIKKVPALRGKSIINLFLEPSTRTRVSFELAGKRLSADTINISGSESSVVKGETLLDTARNLEAMNPDILVVRHKESGAPHFLAKHLVSTAVVNAGDGLHEHPTQALLDCLTLMQHFGGSLDDIRGKSIAIVGDIRHSRVARSNIWAHLLLKNKISIVAPPTLVPPFFKEAFGIETDALEIRHDLAEGIRGADIVMCLRMQVERQNDHFVPSLEEYSREYGVSERLLAANAPRCVVLHPGPVNRGIEISSEVVDGPRSLVSKQVALGVAVRMAVLFALGAVQKGGESEDN